MSHKDFIFNVKTARRLPDPVWREKFNSESHIFNIRCNLMPEGIGNDPNARSTNTKKSVYRKVKESLLAENTPNSIDNGMFHLKNKGIIIVANSVTQKGDNSYIVNMEENNHGILDGGHTYELITDNKEQISDDQYVRVEVRTGMSSAWVSEMAEGLNTTVQVSEESLFDSRGQFNWLKSIFKESKIPDDSIAWSENENGTIHARDLLCILTLFNIALYPNKENNHPIVAYNSPNKILPKYDESSKSYEAMSEIVKDILFLYDYIRATSRDVWNAAGGKGKSLAVTETRKRGKFSFPFSNNKDADHRLHKPAAFPLLAAFRWFVVRSEIDSGFKIKWDTSFDKIKSFWDRNGYMLLQSVVETSQDLNYQLASVGKNNGLWKTLHSQVGMKKIDEEREGII